MEKHELIAKLEERTSALNAQRIADALGDELIGKLHFTKSGMSATIFAIEGTHMVLKAADCRLEKNKRITHSRYMLREHCQAIVLDDSAISGQPPANIILEVKPALTHEGVTPLHQEVLRYQLWTQEGLEFWDHIPAASYPKEVKNVMLDHRGVPYQIDEDAVRPFDDRYNDYPPNHEGKRSDEQYLHMRANSWNHYGRPDAIGNDQFAKIKMLASQGDWPSNQTAVFGERTDHAIVEQFKDAFAVLSPQLRYASR